MDLGTNTETSSHDGFWTSLNLVSTQTEDDHVFDSNPQSCLSKPNTRDNESTQSDNYRVYESKSLPITSIISRIQAEDSGSDDELCDSGVSSHFPPPSYTGGKWRPTSTVSFQERPEHALMEEDITDHQILVDGTCDVIAGEEIVSSELNCAICSVTFSKAENLIVHLTSRKHRSNITLENHHIAAQLYTKYHTELLKRSAYQCACCTFAAIKHEDLVMHLKSQQHTETTSTLSGPLECVQCAFLDYTGAEMLTHCLSTDHHLKICNKSVVIKERRSQIQCNQCTKVLHSTLHYTRHMRYQHSRPAVPLDQMKTCQYCSFKGMPSAVSQHISRTHRNERPFLCKVCQTDFHSKYDLVKHYSTKKHIERFLDSYKGRITVKELSTLSKDQPIKNMKVCKYCPYTTVELEQLQQHYIQDHSNEHADESNLPSVSSCTPIYCRYCLKRQADKSQLFTHEISHVQVHLSSLSETTQCFICFTEVANLLEHLAQHNPYIKNKQSLPEEKGKSSLLSNDRKADGVRYFCTVDGCSRSYKTKGDLNVHLSTHTGERALPCSQCQKQFPTKKQLRAHMLTHSSLTPYSCDYCNYKCKTRCHLQRHMRIHAGSRPYSCPHCQYSSTTIGNLRKHIMVSKKHKGLHMYECTVSGCKYVADRLSSLSQHLSQVHSVNDKRLMIKSTENDWTEVIEGHSIIPAQH